MGTRIITEYPMPTCDAGDGDAPGGVERFGFTFDGVPYVAELHPECRKRVEDLLAPLTEHARPADDFAALFPPQPTLPTAAEEEFPKHEEEPEAPAEQEIPPSSDATAEERAACREWWPRAARKHNLPEPSGRGRIPAIVWETWWTTARQPAAA